VLTIKQPIGQISGRQEYGFLKVDQLPPYVTLNRRFLAVKGLVCYQIEMLQAKERPSA